MRVSILAIVCYLCLCQCQSDSHQNLVIPPIIPKPVSINKLSNHSVDLSTLDLKVLIDPNFGKQGHYELIVMQDELSIRAADSAAIHYAKSTVQQLKDFSESYDLPELKIADHPRFPYRGMHLDVCRHMFTVDDIKSYLDKLAYYKFNYFHWHLTEDQGWRIEIKKYPKLQSVAAYRDETLIGHYSDQPPVYDGKSYGGYYTQEDVKEIVKYAQAKGIEVIPEIEMPGHSLAALAAYPELGCDENKKYKTATTWGVFDDIYCPTETTFNFLEDIIDEIVPLFPSKYVHIGGDEAPKIAWTQSPYCQQLIKDLNLKDEHGLQSYFISRMEKYINAKGKQIIGWDEILEGGLAPNATVMSWRGIQGGIEAAKSGHDVIMTPTSHCYFDYYQSDHQNEPLAIGGYLPINKVYDYNPIPTDLDSTKHHHILGGQGNVWTEYITDFDQVEYMVYSRLMALSEALWSPLSLKDYDDYITRYEQHADHWKSTGVNISNHLLDLKYMIVKEKGALTFKFHQLPNSAALYINSSFGDTVLHDGRPNYSYEQSGSYKFTAKKGNLNGRTTTAIVNKHKAMGQSIQLKFPPNASYSGYGALSLINGIHGPEDKYSGNEWLGFAGVPLIATITFEQPLDISKLELRTFNSPGQWIYPAQSISIYAQLESESDYEMIIDQQVLEMPSGKIQSNNIPMQLHNVKALRIELKDYGIIPSGAQGADNRAWLFVDEIVIN